MNNKKRNFNKTIISIALLAGIGASIYGLKEESKNKQFNDYDYDSSSFAITETEEVKTDTTFENETYEDNLITTEEYLTSIGVSSNITPIELIEALTGYEVPILNDIPEVHDYFTLHKDRDAYAYSAADDLVWHLKKGYPMAEGINIGSVDEVLREFGIKTASNTLNR